MFQCVVWFLGWIVLLKLGYHLAKCLYCLYVIKGKNLVEEYTGRDGFALITGSTDGIGLAFAKAFAKRGVNVVITGRNKEKLQKTKEELINSFPKVKIQSIHVDFSQPGFMDTIRKETQNTDIGILVNNVATCTEEIIGNLKDSDIEYIIRLNCMPNPLMLNHFLPLMNKRSKRSGLIDVASTLSYYPSGETHFIAAIQAYIRSLTMGVYSAGNYKNVDFLSTQPGFTKTNMLPDHGISALVPRPQSVAEAALRDLGFVSESFGWSGHYLNGFIRQVLQFIIPVQFRDITIGKLENFIREKTTTSPN